MTEREARAEILQLTSRHGLGFVFNPGGGEFTCLDARYPLHGFRCQVSTMDDVADLATLRAAIAKSLASKPPTTTS